MVIQSQLSDKAIGLLSRNSLLVTQIQLLLPDVIIFNSQDMIINKPLDALLIDDVIDDFVQHMDKIISYGIPTILLADLPIDQLTKALDAGITDYISKPISSKLLEHRLNQMIDSNQPVSSLHHEDIENDVYSKAILLDKLPDAFVSTDTDYIITNWNESAEQLFGWRAEEVIGQRLYGLLPTIYMDSSRDDIMNALNSGEAWRGELIQSNKFGEKTHIFASSNCIVGEFGKIQGYITVLRDNTEYQALIEQSLVSTETEYQSIIASMTDPVFVFDAEGTYLKIPKVNTPNYYMPPEKMIGKRLHDLFPTDVADRFVDAIQTALETQSVQTLEYDLLIEDRRAFFSSAINPIVGRDEVVWVSRDITHAKLNELALSETEKRYRQLFENANDMILMIELETGRIIDVNKQTQKQLGYSQSELMRLNLNDIEQPLQDTESHIITRTLVTSGHIIVEQIYNRKDGTTIPVEISARLIEYQGRKVLLSFARNIEQRKLAMQAQTEERFFAEALGDTISKLASALTMSDVLDVMVSTVSKVVDSESINIMLVEGDSAKIIRKSGYREPSSQLSEVHIPSLFTLQSMRETQQAFVISDVRSDSRWVSLDNIEVRSFVGAPIVLKSEVIGFINLDSSKPHHFLDKHRQRLQAFADQAAIAIENAQLYEASQRYTEDLRRANEELQYEIIIRQKAEESERRQRILGEALQASISALNNTLNIDDVLDAVLDAMKLSVEHDASNIMLLEDEMLTIVRQRGYPTPLPNKIPLNAVQDIPIVYNSKKPLIITDTRSYDIWKDDKDEVHGEIHWVRSNIKIPIIHDDVVIGILLLDSTEPNKFTMGHADLLQTFANQVSIAVQNARLYQAERQQRILAEALQDSITVMNGTLDIDEVLDKVLNSMKLVIEHEASNIMLIENDLLNVVRQRGYKRIAPQNIPIESFPEMVLIRQTKQPYLIGDTAIFDKWSNVGDTEWIRCNLKIPIVYDDEVIGLLNLDSSEPYRYTIEDGKLAQTFANQVSIALQNARLYQQAQQEIAEHKQTQQQLQKRSAELELLREASLQLNATFDLIDIFKTTADYALKLINADCAHVFLYDGESLHFGIGLWDNTYQDHPYMPIRPAGITYSVARSGEIIVVNSMIQDDVYDNKRVDGAIACIPLKVKGEVRGVMNISYFTPYQFIDDELRAMGLLADQSAIAIQNSEHLRLLEAEIHERKRAEIAEREQRIFAETLRDTAITLNQQLNTDELFETILRAVEQVITVHDAASIIAMNPDKVTGTVVSDRGFEQFGGSIQGLVLDFTGSNVKQHLMEQRKPVFITDTYDSDIWIQMEQTVWIRSHISLPIYIKDDILALINLDSQYPNTFTPQHIDRLTVFSHQAAIALRNAQLVEQIRGYTHELESKVQERTLELENERILLQLERSQLRAILDAMRDGVYYTNNTHNPTYINNALSEMTGYSTDDWLSGRVFEEINRNANIDRDELWQNIERHLNINRFWHSESIVTRADGTQFEASLTRTEVKGIDNKRVGIVTVIRNISLQKQLEEQKARFIANAAHELRTPITNIKTRLFLMKYKPERFTEHLAIAESATNWMQSLVDNLFDQSRFERGIIRLDLKEFILQDLMSIVVETQQPEANRKNIKIVPDWNDSPIIITGDISRLRQVVTNLINNAVNYTPGNGLITVSLHQEMLASMTVAIISVRDTGIGIDAKHLPYLFQPFYQATDDSRGAGLGLSIAREIIEAHKGTIYVASKVGEGTTFYINLPLLPLSKSSEET
jgi:PAS domain S-box-containing protein